MKRNFAMLVILPFLFACVPSPTEPVSPAQPVPEISTTLPNKSDTFPSEMDTALSGSPFPSPTSVAFSDNGKSFVLLVGDSFLLDLGSDIYEWTVAIDNQDVVAFKTGETVPEGSQGYFEMLKSGTATLTAAGDPLCRKSSPPCGMPNVLFRVTLIVE